jgi:hypothetical protein
MRVPLPHAQGHPFIQTLFTHPFRRCVHCAFQLISVRRSFIEERGWLCRIEAEGGFEPLPLAGEVIVGLFYFRVKGFKPIFDGNVIILVLRERVSKCLGDVCRACLVVARERTARGPLHMEAHVLVGLRHRLRGALFVVMLLRHLVLMRLLNVVVRLGYRDQHGALAESNHGEHGQPTDAGYDVEPQHRFNYTKRMWAFLVDRPVKDRTQVKNRIQLAPVCTQRYISIPRKGSVPTSWGFKFHSLRNRVEGPNHKDRSRLPSLTTRTAPVDIFSRHRVESQPLDRHF